MKKIVFISAHDYVAKRQGGFHVFAKNLSEYFDVVFFSYPRSSFIKMRKQSPIEYKNISFFKDRDETIGKVRNVSRLFFIPPVKVLKYIPKVIHKRFFWLTFPSFSGFCNRYFDGVDYFMFESNASVLLYDFLKTKYPTAKFLYRPSDPMLNSPDLAFFHQYEINYVKNCDFVFAVNQLGVDLYKSRIPDFSEKHFEIISNGIDLSAYNQMYERPAEFADCKNIVSYVGARGVEWNLLVKVAENLKDCSFFIVCPESPNKIFQNAIGKLPNLHYIQGIPPQRVPQFVKNSDVIIVPNPTGMYKKYPWGITAKYYQAMYSQKPVVAYSDNDSLKKYGISVTHTYEDFIEAVKQAITKGSIVYDFNFIEKDWKTLSERMKEIILSL